MSLIVNGHKVKFLVDSGSMANIIALKEVERCGLKLKKFKGHRTIKAFGGSRVKIKGIVEDVELKRTNGYRIIADLLVTNDMGCILNAATSKGLKIFSQPQVNRVTVLDNKVKVGFKWKDNCKKDGTVYHFRSMPYSLLVKVEEVIERWLKEGVIYPVENPQMSTPILAVIKKKDGDIIKLRICGDYRLTANKYIDTGAYAIPTMEDIHKDFVGCKYFSVIDLKDAFHQIELEEESQKLTVISTHKGHFAFKVMPFGISAAPLAFQEAMDKTLKGLKYTKPFQDDILTGGRTKKEHDENLAKLLKRLTKYGFKVNKEKSQIRKKAIKYLGFVLTEGKLLPQKERLDKLRNLELPTSRKELRSYIAKLRHYGGFVRGFSGTTVPIYNLLREGVKWHWKQDYTDRIRKILTQMAEGVVVPYDINKQIYLSTDASKEGIAWVISHDSEMEEVVTLGSRVLAKAEKNSYSNIEREALAIVEGVKNCRKYLLGRKFIIQTDHGPLEHIFSRITSKPISARLANWQLTLLEYDFIIKYREGELMTLVDLMSRFSQK